MCCVLKTVHLALAVNQGGGGGGGGGGVGGGGGGCMFHKLA